MPVLQLMLEVGPPNDKYEQEADRVAGAVMRMADPQRTGPIDLAGRATPDGVQRLCAECEEEVRRQPVEDEGEGLQMKRASGAMPEIGAGLQARISGLPGGQPLPPPLRAFFEPRFGRSFEHVRIHTDPPAAAAARAIDASAFTLGSDIAIAHGQYRPNTRAGRYLLSHELTHIAQQGPEA
ncbi:MAG: DUF4157 domain-containing protein, partial [Geminicoccaceae bacterium]